MQWDEGRKRKKEEGKNKKKKEVTKKNRSEKEGKGMNRRKNRSEKVISNAVYNVDCCVTVVIAAAQLEPTG